MNDEITREQDETTLEQGGFDAISEKLHALYPGQEGRFYGTVIPYFLGGNDPLDGVEVWKSEEGIPHWHYVTYGFTELYQKECEDPEVSGFGFELTFRLKREGEEEPPVWPMNLLQNLARYVFSSGNPFGPGHHLDCNSPIALESDTRLTALAFQIDPELGEMDTPNGHMIFLQAVGITADELEAVMCWNTGKFLAELEKTCPMGIVDLSRASRMDDPAFRAVWKQGMEQDGSSTGFFYLEQAGVSLQDGHARLTLGAGHIETLANMLRARLGKGRPLFLQGGEAAVQFLSGKPELWEEDRVLTMSMLGETVEELCGLLRPHAGEYPLTSYPLTVELIPTQIRDAQGNILREIG